MYAISTGSKILKSKNCKIPKSGSVPELFSAAQINYYTYMGGLGLWHARICAS